MLSQAAADRMGMASSDIECFDLLSLHGPMMAAWPADRPHRGAIMRDRSAGAGRLRTRERDPNDRRRVIVRPRLERHADEATVAAYGPVASAMERLLARYTDEELELILDFITRANAELHAHITQSAPPRPTKTE